MGFVEFYEDKEESQLWLREYPIVVSPKANIEEILLSQEAKAVIVNYSHGPGCEALYRGTKPH